MMGHTPGNILLYSLVVLFTIHESCAIQCYQCSSEQDPKGEDNCGAYSTFRKDQHISIDCNSDESHTPGSFCMKVIQQSPIGFVWDGRWRQVIRRCASVADTGVTGVCNWGVKLNGIYWEECYCSEDSCNEAPRLYTYWILLAAAVVIAFLSPFL
ncbi:UPAR/Ly6 domain-containing protein crok-like [Hetaerina americana]|uniref:UPAR/Ly6 domain-containing protein crok-like n=1 Tax=Hetaerina americana TaxID=62018 RepID=UPI003A7F37B4